MHDYSIIGYPIKFSTIALSTDSIYLYSDIISDNFLTQLVATFECVAAVGIQLKNTVQVFC